MALTRKMLAAMDVPAEKIDEIISAHTETVSAIKEELSQYKNDSEALKETKAELEKTTKELEKFKAGDWEKKYNDMKSEYETFKSDTEAKATKSAKETAYKKLLADAGVSAKRIDSILKISDLADISLDDDGNIKDADKVTESVKKEWADFIQTTHEQGAKVSTPPANNGGADVKKPSRASTMVAQYRNEHYGNPTKED